MADLSRHSDRGNSEFARSPGHTSPVVCVMSSSQTTGNVRPDGKQFAKIPWRSCGCGCSSAVVRLCGASAAAPPCRKRQIGGNFHSGREPSSEPGWEGFRNPSSITILERLHRAKEDSGMRKSTAAVGLMLLTWIVDASMASAQSETLCEPDEVSIFACKLKKTKKTVSLCASSDFGKDVGYMQYRFGSIGTVELTAPRQKKGHPNFMLIRSADQHAEYNDFSFPLGRDYYRITNFRRITPQNGDGLPTPESSDTLTVTDSEKSMKEGNIVFSDECERLGNPINVDEIGRKTGTDIHKGGF